jgi:type III secretion protein B
MDNLLFRLAKQLGREPFAADKMGCYHFLIDGHSLILERLGTQLVVRSSLDWQLKTDTPDGLCVVQGILEMVTRWGRQYPQGLALNPQGEVVLEARLDLEGLAHDELERVLAAQVGIIESIKPGLLQPKPGSEWRPSVWRP